MCKRKLRQWAEDRIYEGVAMREEGLCVTNQQKVNAVQSYNKLQREFICLLSFWLH